MPVLIKTAYFIGLLGGLVFFHELGHFVVAKLCGVKVLKFSLGFGPRLWGVRRGETDYQLAALPLGGFVMMLGADPSATIPPEDRGRGYHEQAPYKRILISLAGPASNVLLALLVIFGMNLTPQPQEPAIINVVVPGEAADVAGFQPRDRVRMVDGQPVRSFEEMKEQIEERPGQTFDVVVERGGEQKTLRVTTSVLVDRNPIETTRRGRIGVMPGNVLAVVGVKPGSRAWNAGLRTFDQIVGVNGRKVTYDPDVQDALRGLGEGTEVRFDVLRSKSIDLKTSSVGTSQVLSIAVPAGEGPLGIDSPDLYVQEVDPEGPSAKAGLRPLDKIVAVGGEPVRSAMRLAALMDDKATVELLVERGSEQLPIRFHPAQKTRRHWLMGSVTRMEDGFFLNQASVDPTPASERVMVSYPPVQAFTRALDQTGTQMRQIVLGIAAAFSGSVSPRSFGSVIMLGQLSGIVSEHGLLAFLAFFASVSINIGLVNLLPLPVLDGFNIVLATIEGLSRRVIPLRVVEMATRVGFAVLVALMALVLTSDIARVVGL